MAKTERVPTNMKQTVKTRIRTTLEHLKTLTAEPSVTHRTSQFFEMRALNQQLTRNMGEAAMTLRQSTNTTEGGGTCWQLP